ncbi:unnamed protein product [Allacma fusca]|uniref:Uncharacterized protein n=1 Tax=Allacma fusca TaxID=39272 RepID=A0A8J2J9X7_9HEXA|nr:unnamed protein product [Allacma fusca]
MRLFPMLSVIIKIFREVNSFFLEHFFRFQDLIFGMLFCSGQKDTSRNLHKSSFLRSFPQSLLAALGSRDRTYEDPNTRQCPVSDSPKLL